MKCISPTKPIISLYLLTVTLTLNSCLFLSWKNPPSPVPDPSSEQIPQGKELVYFYIPDYLLDGSQSAKHVNAHRPQYIYKAFQQRLRSQTEIHRLKFSPSPPESGIFCSFRIEERSASVARNLSAFLSLLTVFLIPSYDDTLDYYVTYELYVDTKLAKRYRYEIEGKVFRWVAAPLAIPFLSGRWEAVIYGEGEESYGRGDGAEGLVEALWLTTRAFWLDAHRDGLI